MTLSTKCLLLLLMLSLTSCYKTITEKQIAFAMDETEKDKLFTVCNEINAQGDIQRLLFEIKKKTREAIVLLGDGEDIPKKSDRIEEIALSVDEMTKKVISLSRTEWVSDQWNYEVSWSIDKNDFDDLLGTRFSRGFEISDTKLHDIIYMGEKRNDLAPNISWTQNGNVIELKYKNSGTSLELCQLHKTLMILIEVKYRHIKNKNVRFFNLTLNL